MKNLLISVALAALMVAKGQGQTAPVPRGTDEQFVLPAAKGQAPAAVDAFSGGARNPVAYSWPSSTIMNPYPTVSLPNCGAPPACAAHEDDNGLLLNGDPLLDCSPWASGHGWFAALEVDAVGPAVRNRLTAPVTLGGAITTVQLPSADLNWTAMPRVELGYRLGQVSGELLISYRGLNATGTGNITGFDIAGNTAPLSSHLNVNVIDFDYASRENSLGPLWDMKWRAGVRVATLFFDSSAATPLLSERESNNFVGAGLHFGLGLKRRLGNTGFSLIGDVDGGAVLGRVNQLYTATLPGTAGGSTSASANEPAPVLEVRFGVDFSPRSLPNLHLSTGYLLECWWTVGETLGTQGEVNYQGIFCRGEWRY